MLNRAPDCYQTRSIQSDFIIKLPAQSRLLPIEPGTCVVQFIAGDSAEQGAHC